MTRKALDIYMYDIIEDYTVGKMSEKALAEKWGVSRSVIRRLLLKGNVAPRDRSKSMYLRMQQSSPEERQRLTKAAHDAVRGRKVPLDKKIELAKLRQTRLTAATDEELAFAGMLVERGIHVTPQLAIGPYNCDIGTESVAVEILGGNWHWYGLRKRKLLNKLRYFVDHGWHVLMIIVDKGRGFVLDASVADYTASYIKGARRNKSTWREYRMIGGAGQTITQGSSKDDEIALIPTFAGRKRCPGKND